MSDNKDIDVRERLASLETKLDFVQDLLKEIRDDIKDQPSHEEFLDLEERVSKLEAAQTNLMIKVGVLSGLAGLIGGILIKLIFKV